MEQITEYLLHSDIDYDKFERLMTLIGEYGREKYAIGWNKAIETAGYGTPPAPTIRNEVRNAPIVNNVNGVL